jgi:hypothetical protein
MTFHPTRLARGLVMRAHVGAATHRRGRMREVAGIRRAVSMCVAVLLSVTVFVAVAQAAECKMNVVVYDSGDSGLRGQLRNAIVDVCDGGTVRVRPGFLIRLEQGELVIPSGKTLTIMNPSQGVSTAVVIDAHGASRVIVLQAAADLTLSNVIVRGGSGGGINNKGSLTVVGGNVTGNTGFGILNTGDVTLSDDAAVTANQGTGVLNGRDFSTFPPTGGNLTLEDNSRISGNVGSFGGGIANDGVVTMNEDSSISGNAASLGGGIFNGPDPFFDSVVTLNDSSRISENEAGGIVSTFGSLVRLNGSSTISGNTSQRGGGGISNDDGSVVLNGDSSITRNAAKLGGGIHNFGLSGSSVTLNDNSRIAGNIATDGLGGGIYSEQGSSVTLNDASSITGNIPDNCFPSSGC